MFLSLLPPFLAKSQDGCHALRGRLGSLSLLFPQHLPFPERLRFTCFIISTAFMSGVSNLRHLKTVFFILLLNSNILLLGCTFEPLKPVEHSYDHESESKKPYAEDEKVPLEAKLMKSSLKEPLSPEDTNELLNEVGSNWLYGQGMGETAATIGTIVVFPPYALWVLGNAALQLSGEEPVEVSKMLPEESGKIWKNTYDEIVSVPGRTTAAVVGEEYRTQEVARNRIEAVLDKNTDKLATRKKALQR